MEGTAIAKIYDQLMQVFGGTNPNQFFTMLMPGTTLDQVSYAYDTTRSKPEQVAAAESRLVDQMFDIAKVTGSSNGQRLSSQYKQALEVLVPKFDPNLADVKRQLRDFINLPAPENAKVGDQPFTGSLEDYYFALYERWLGFKSKWVADQIDKKKELNNDEEAFLEWFEGVAENRLAQIDAAFGEILAVFSPADMDAVLSALETGPGGEIEEAIATLQDIRRPSPSGGYVYPIDLLPDDWFLDLASDINPVDLLQDPAFISITISARRQAIQSSILQIQALLTKVPSNTEMKTAADALSKAQTDYTTAQSDLFNTYSANTVVAVEKFAAAAAAVVPTAAVLSETVAAVSQAKGDSSETAAQKKGGAVLTDADVKTLLDGQKDLIKKQQSLLTSAQALSDAGMNLAANKAQTFGNLPVMLERLKSQLADLQNMQTQLATSSASPVSKPSLGRPPVENTEANKLIKAVEQALKASDATKDSVKTAVDDAVDGIADTDIKASFASIKTAVDTEAGRTATPTPTPESVANAAIGKVKAIMAAADQLVQTVDQALKAAGADKNSVKKAVDDAVTAITDNDIKTSLTSIQTAVDTEAGQANATPQSVADKAIAKAIPLASPTPGVKPAEKSGTSERFMTLQLSFSSDEMTSTDTTITTAGQSSWSADLFFGSVGSESSYASSVNSKDAFDKSTAIEIGLKAAKVDINRGWFDPGLFKLTSDMNRLSTASISKGAVDLVKGTKEMIQEANDCIFPCFPVAFVVAKDVTIRFKATESSLHSVQSVIDSRSASGGGFFCFSASSSSSTNTDTSKLSSKTEGKVITISMPGPQILGWFLEYTPEDKSTSMNVKSTDGINIIEFMKKLQPTRG